MSSTERFERAYRDHYWAVVRYVARRLGGGDDAARDLAAEVFAVAWRRRLAMPVDPLPWLYVVARHVVANELRRRGRLERLERRLSLEPVVENEPLAPDGDATESAWVREALSRLSPADQEVLRLAAWERLGTDHLADALAVNRSAAAMRLHRARERLREVLTTDPVLAPTLRRSR